MRAGVNHHASASKKQRDYDCSYRDEADHGRDDDAGHVDRVAHVDAAGAGGNGARLLGSGMRAESGVILSPLLITISLLAGCPPFGFSLMYVSPADQLGRGRSDG